ncbi:MAG: hypothetical protein JO127_12130 [Caulobacteraceae bacterium]|nr:hypothetical protein [Caulobacteraceae bacterium]
MDISPTVAAGRPTDLTLLWRGSEWALGAGLALALIGCLFNVAPTAAGGATFMDARLPIMAVLVFFAGVAPHPPPSVASGAAAFALLIVGGAAVVAASWTGRARDLAELRTELAYVRPGASILPTWTGSPIGEEASRRELPNFMLLNEHLAALAVIERRAFWPLEFADPTQQPLAIRESYKRMAAPSGWPTPWVRLSDNPATPADISAHRYLNRWRERFDFVLLVGPPASLRRTPSGLPLVRSGDAASLYQVIR